MPKDDRAAAISSPTRIMLTEVSAVRQVPVGTYSCPLGMVYASLPWVWTISTCGASSDSLAAKVPSNHPGSSALVELFLMNTSPTCTKPEGDAGAMVWDAAPLSSWSDGSTSGCGTGVTGTGAAGVFSVTVSSCGKAATSAHADSSSGDSRSASSAGSASVSAAVISPSSQRSSISGRRTESRTAAAASRRLSLPIAAAVTHSVAAASVMAAKRRKRSFLTGIPPRCTDKPMKQPCGICKTDGKNCHSRQNVNVTMQPAYCISTKM